MPEYKLFLTGVNSGKIEVVEILGENKNIDGGIYIRYETGGTDTTKARFLFDIPSGLNTMPAELTAENGGKHLMLGEFFEVVKLECAACDQGNGTYTYRVPISWSAIKEIYAKAAAHFGKLH